MNDGVFFAVSPILWENIPYFWVFFWISVSLFSSFFLFQKYFKNWKDRQKEFSHSLPSLEEKNFEKKAFDFLKSLIAHKFAPKQSFAHSNADILSYCDDLQLKEIWHQLETIRYTSHQLPSAERKKIYDILHSYTSQ